MSGARRLLPVYAGVKTSLTVRPRIIFITGTDTGVGKTVLTCLLLSHLRQNRSSVLALKPFCSGDRADAELLQDLQDGQLALDQINPFYFQEPLAPFVAARLHHRRISLNQTLQYVRRLCDNVPQLTPKIISSTNPQIRQSANPVMLIEGAGGLLTPLGEGFTAADLIKQLRCEVIIAAANRLGTINHTLLTALKLQSIGVQRFTVVLMDVDRLSRITQLVAPNLGVKADHASRTNPKILSELLHPKPIFNLPYIPQIAKTLGKTDRKSLLITCAKKLKKTLARIIQ